MSPPSTASFTSNIYGIDELRTVEGLKRRFKLGSTFTADNYMEEVNLYWTDQLNNAMAFAIAVITHLGVARVQRMLAHNAANGNAMMLPMFNMPVQGGAPPVGPAQGHPWYIEVAKAVTVIALRDVLKSWGSALWEPIIRDARDYAINALYRDTTKQMCIITVVNETLYGFKLAGWYNMIENEPRARFSELHARQPIKDGDGVAWGFCTSGSGWVTGSAMAIKLETTKTPDGAGGFYFIVSAASPAWTPTNTIGLAMNTSDPTTQCKATEGVGSETGTERSAKSPDGKVMVQVTLEEAKSKWAYVFVRITHTEVAVFRD